MVTFIICWFTLKAIISFFRDLFNSGDGMEGLVGWIFNLVWNVIFIIIGIWGMFQHWNIHLVKG